MKKIIAFTLTFVLFHNVFSKSEVHEYEKITTSNGLSNDNVNKVIQDDRGMIWFSTSDGLNSYDGFEVKVYKGPKGTDITRDVYNTRYSPDNKIYLFSSDGVNIFDIKTRKFSRFEIPEQMVANNQEINDIQFNNDGSMWLLSNFQPHLNLYNEGEITPFEIFDHNINNDKVGSYRDTKGNLWIFSAYAGLYKFDTKLMKATHVDFRAIGQEQRTTTVTEDSKGNIWVGAWPWGIMQITNSDKIVGKPEGNIFSPGELTPISNLEQIFFRDLLYDDKKNCIYGGHSNGYVTIQLQKNNADSFAITQHLPDYNQPEGLHANVILDIFKDQENILWFGSVAGVQKLNFYKKKFLPISSKKFLNLRSTKVTAIMPFGNKYLLGVENCAVCLFDPQTNLVTAHTANPELQPMHEGYMNVAYSLLKTKVNNTNSFILGSRYRGIWVVSCNSDYSEVTAVLSYDGNRDLDEARAILEMSKNTYLYGSKAGLGVLNIAETELPLTLNDLSFKSINLHENGDFRTLINTAFKDSKGNYWVAPLKKGLYKVSNFNGFEPENINYKHYEMDLNAPQALHSKDIQTIFEDSKGRIWIGGIDAGLMRYDSENDAFIEFTQDEGWPCNSVYSIQEDKEGMIWVSTEMGLIKFNPSQTLKEGLVRYTTDDGLAGNVFLPNSSIKDDQGNLLFGGHNGFNIFKPEEIEFNEFTPPIIITDLTVYSKRDKNGSYQINADTLEIKNNVKHCRLKYFEYAIRIEFTSLTYSNQTKNKFAYQLEGFDDDWIYKDASTRYAYYSNLSPGKYTFKVRAYNSDGFPNETPETINITIRPPWWKTIPFYILVILLLIFGIRAIIIRREKQVKRDKAMLEEKLLEGEKEMKSQKEAVQTQREELRKRDIAEKDQKWYNRGMILVGDVINNNKDDIEKLSQEFLNELIAYLKAIQGAIYILNDNSESDVFLELIRSYGLPKEKLNIKKIEIGENLIGSCFKDGDLMILDDIPENYTSISTGIGETKPKQILIMPLIFDENKIGVIELSTLNSFDENHIDWTKKICEMYSSNINSLKLQAKMTALVENMKEQAEAMQAQEEELRQNMEEMQATNEESNRREVELKKLNEEIALKEKKLHKIIKDKEEALEKAHKMLQKKDPPTSKSNTNKTDNKSKNQ